MKVWELSTQMNDKPQTCWGWNKIPGMLQSLHFSSVFKCTPLTRSPHAPVMGGLVLPRSREQSLAPTGTAVLQAGLWRLQFSSLSCSPDLGFLALTHGLPLATDRSKTFPYAPFDQVWKSKSFVPSDLQCSKDGCFQGKKDEDIALERKLLFCNTDNSQILGAAPFGDPALCPDSELFPPGKSVPSPAAFGSMHCTETRTLSNNAVQKPNLSSMILPLSICLRDNTGQQVCLLKSTHFHLCCKGLNCQQSMFSSCLSCPPPLFLEKAKRFQTFLKDWSFQKTWSQLCNNP